MQIKDTILSPKKLSELKQLIRICTSSWPLSSPSERQQVVGGISAVVFRPAKKENDRRWTCLWCWVRRGSCRLDFVCLQTFPVVVQSLHNRKVGALLHAHYLLVLFSCVSVFCNYVLLMHCLSLLQENNATCLPTALFTAKKKFFLLISII